MKEIKSMIRVLAAYISTPIFGTSKSLWKVLESYWIKFSKNWQKIWRGNVSNRYPQWFDIEN